MGNLKNANLCKLLKTEHILSLMTEKDFQKGWDQGCADLFQTHQLCYFLNDFLLLPRI